MPFRAREEGSEFEGRPFPISFRNGGEGEKTGVWVGASNENSVFVSLVLSGAHLLVAMGAWFYWLQ